MPLSLPLSLPLHLYLSLSLSLSLSFSLFQALVTDMKRLDERIGQIESELVGPVSQRERGGGEVGGREQERDKECVCERESNRWACELFYYLLL